MNRSVSLIFRMLAWGFVILFAINTLIVTRPETVVPFLNRIAVDFDNDPGEPGKEQPASHSNDDWDFPGDAEVFGKRPVMLPRVFSGDQLDDQVRRAFIRVQEIARGIDKRYITSWHGHPYNFSAAGNRYPEAYLHPDIEFVEFRANSVRARLSDRGQSWLILDRDGYKRDRFGEWTCKVSVSSTEGSQRPEVRDCRYINQNINAQKPSFSCKTAYSPAQGIICRYLALRKKEQKLRKIYEKYSSSPDKDEYFASLERALKKCPVAAKHEYRCMLLRMTEMINDFAQGQEEEYTKVATGIRRDWERAASQRLSSDEDREKAVLQDTLRYLGHFRLPVETYVAMEGKQPQFLSDMNLRYPDINWPSSVDHIRLLEDSSIAARLAGTDKWVVMRRDRFKETPYYSWGCETGFEPPSEYDSCIHRNLDIEPVTPGFSCQQASAEQKRFICHHDRLRTVEGRLDTVWKQARKALPEVVSEYKHEQWLNSRKEACAPGTENRTMCLYRKTRYRINQYQSLLDGNGRASASSPSNDQDSS